MQHAARRAGGDGVEGYDGDELVAGWGAGGAGEVEDQASVRVGGVASLEDVDVAWSHGGAGAWGEGRGIWVWGWGWVCFGEGGGEAGEEAEGCEDEGAGCG